MMMVMVMMMMMIHTLVASSLLDKGVMIAPQTPQQTKCFANFPEVLNDSRALFECLFWVHVGESNHVSFPG
jgi:hypothetical protein